MKHYNKHIAVFILLIYIFMIFPGLYVYAGPEDEAYQLGYTNGWVDGIEAAEIDYANGDKKNYARSMPNSTEITEMYNLDGESSSYRSNFISGYKAGFREGYNMAYDNPRGKKEIPANYPEALGYAIGESHGYLDFYKGESNKWTRNIPTTAEIIEIFDLMKEPNDYKNNFISTFKTKYKEGYENGYRLAKYEPYNTALNQGAKDGEKFGKILGSNWGKYDYYNGYDNNWEKNLPADRKLVFMFSLDNDYSDYANAFIAAFKLSYRNSYEEAYRTARVEYYTLVFEKGYTYGKEIGRSKGQSLATIDVITGKSNNYSRHNFSDNDIISEFKLFYEEDRYEQGFISGFREGFKTGYIDAYQAASYERHISKTVTEIVPISGDEILSGDRNVLLTIDKGIFYNEVVVSIDKMNASSNEIIMPQKDKLTKASDLYNIKIMNLTNTLNQDKPIKLSFEYYGPDNGGIYKYIDKQWIYMPSKIDSNSISTYINPETLNNKSVIFGVFIDNKTVNPNDLRGHWAKDEITAYIRRGIVNTYEDKSFRPDTCLTRRQAASYISKVYKKDIKQTENEDAPITYKELEEMMMSVTSNSEFSWRKIEEKIMRSKDKLPMSFISMDNYITRAEFVYMLYCLNE